MSWWLLIAAAYLLGSVPFAYLVSKSRAGVDIRDVGSGNAGATNVLRELGAGPAVTVLAADVVKGLLPVAVAQALDAPVWVQGATATAAVLGHVFPVFLSLRGGKGVATAAGAFSLLLALPLTLSGLVFLGMVVWRGYVSLGSIVAAASFPLFAWLSAGAGLGDEDAWTTTVCALIVGGLIVAKHWKNIRRLAAGTEPRLRERGKGIVE
jgi:glycerol-3-phosphate acyltransferase PlsY